MKRILLSGIVMMMSVFVWAQEFPVAWKSKFSFKPERWFYTNDGKYILGRTDTDAEVLDGATGNSIWKVNFKNDLKVKELSRATYNESEGLVLFFNADEKKKPGDKVTLDLASGKELWRTSGYAGVDADNNYHFANNFSAVSAKHMTIVFDNATKKFTGIDLRTGNVKWQSAEYADVDLSKHVAIGAVEGSDFAQVFIVAEDVANTKILYMNIVTGELADENRFTGVGGDYDRFTSGKVSSGRSVDKTQISLKGTAKQIGSTVRFELKASGGVAWSKNFEGPAVRQLFNDAPYVKLDVQGDKIFVIAKNIYVFDLKTGNELWKAPFDNCDASVGMKAKQEFGIAGWPLVSNDVIYYVDLHEDNAIKKVEAQTGRVIWKSEKLKSNDRVPNLTLVNGVLVAQFGGLINTQIFIPNSNGGSTYKSENRFDGNFEVRGYDPASGKVSWNTSALAAKLGDKFKERISTIYPINNKIVVASGENLLSLDPKTGDLVYKTSLMDAKIGSMFEVVPSDDFSTLLIYCDNGVTIANTSTGKLGYTAKVGEISWKLRSNSGYKFTQGENTFIWVGDTDFIGLNLSSGAIKGKMKDNDNPQLTGDGNSILVKDGEKVTRYQVNK